MILVVDKTVSVRAVELRNKLHFLGCPCAVCVSREIKNYRPFGAVMTFTDHFDTMISDTAEEFYSFTIGHGFVNSALRAKNYPDEDTAITEAHTFLMRRLGVTDDRLLPFGICVNKAFFLSDGFCEIYGNHVPLTATESLILKYFIAMSSADKPIRSRMIDIYCSADGKPAKTNRMAVHISHINEKCRIHLGSELIIGSKNGYYSTNNLKFL